MEDDMIQIELTPLEVKTLVYILENDLMEVRSQISAADNMAFKKMLRQHKDVLSKLLDALKEKQELPLAE
jgi:hypothetical protein